MSHKNQSSPEVRAARGFLQSDISAFQRQGSAQRAGRINLLPSKPQERQFFLRAGEIVGKFGSIRGQRFTDEDFASLDAVNQLEASLLGFKRRGESIRRQVRQPGRAQTLLSGRT